MKFLANENFPLADWEVLKAAGLDITHVGNTNPSISDIDVLELANQEERIIVTFDSDYGELVYKYDYKPKGVIYLRLKGVKAGETAPLLLNIFEAGKYKFEDVFTVISENSIRQRLL